MLKKGCDNFFFHSVFPSLYYFLTGQYLIHYMVHTPLLTPSGDSIFIDKPKNSSYTFLLGCLAMNHEVVDWIPTWNFS